ncbi:MAG: 6,7-dimethyl-8-ribityllumazine synthase [Bacteroidales bacterium]|jgi:6,7-dimethyl-8-ribityllumazine synthase|nr:6,7-dimethyl-8-ribityllumazine synthase [Bacteroidales bacterium]NLK54087.1 6,7-dimethyl-8-ribityllumazine synthase [Bacteroidales bacterium]HPV16425.1 6,7-dimethyl-8-ribityllumazine synthase [Bacteroidales bacterium]HPX43604.1 6,7-dimethyl-8-ribityllumazine synthase [Bacteroidales bacterium]HQB85384.1 6,7-dimethyl-8-ribityllumazine synthase [Bacteroidales bacterium]
MSTADLSDYDQGSVPDAGKMTFGIVVSDWNHDITSSLLNGALNTLKKHGAKNKNIIVRHVPGSFELTIGAQLLAESYDVDAIICLGCVIQGETPHFTYICQGVTYGITKLNLDYGIPFIFGVLTTLNHDQALERSGGKHGNKGDEAAVTAIKMVALDREM